MNYGVMVELNSLDTALLVVGLLAKNGYEATIVQEPKEETEVKKPKKRAKIEKPKEEPQTAQEKAWSTRRANKEKKAEQQALPIEEVKL